MKDFKKIGMFSKEHGMRSHLLRVLLGWKNVGFFSELEDCSFSIYMYTE